MMIWTVLEVIFPVFAIALVGYLAARWRVLSAAEVSGISKFVFKIALPVLLFRSMAKIALPDSFNWQFWLTYYSVAVGVYGLGFWISKKWFAHNASEQAIFGLGAAYSNTVLVGLPVISAGLGEQALLPMFMLIAVHAAIMFLLVTLFSERGNGHDLTRGQVASQTFKSLSRNPIIIGLLLGLLVNLLGLPHPKPLDDFIGLLGQAGLPCAIFVLGASLNAYKITGHLREAWALIGFKMILQPALVAFVAFVLFPLEPLWAAVAVMMAALPVGINAFIFAEQYQSGVAFISSAILISTLLAVVSQSVLLAIFMPILGI